MADSSAGRGRGKRPAHLAFIAGKDEDGGRPEPSEPEPVSDRARFVRDEHGELIVIKPGTKEQKEDKTAEDVQYEAYLQGRASGAIRAINGYSDGVDRAAAADSASALEATERAGDRGTRKYAPSRAHGAARFKRPSGRAVTTAEEVTKSAAQSMEEAMRRAREASDDEDEQLLSAATLADKAMAVYNEPVSHMLQRDVHGNDLRLPSLERKLRRFAECFAEDVSVLTCDGKPVLRDFDALKKRYATVFRESGAALRGGWRRRFSFEPPGGSESGLPTFCLDYERHSNLVTPRPGLALDGSMGVTAPREQDLIVLYAAEGGEISRLWIAPDKDGHGGPGCSRHAVESSDTFVRFKAIVEEEAGGAELLMSYQEQQATA